jgi:hypothetical protein
VLRTQRRIAGNEIDRRLGIDRDDVRFGITTCQIARSQGNSISTCCKVAGTGVSKCNSAAPVAQVPKVAGTWRGCTRICK